jgi:arsenate reductase (glutaredoxin)
MIKVYGIPNCDTVKKARAWLDAHGIAYAFHDYKKAGVPADRLQAWCKSDGFERVLNRAGTTFRKLSDADKSGLDQTRALALMTTHASTIKRPIVEHADGVLIGFDAGTWAKRLVQPQQS